MVIPTLTGENWIDIIDGWSIKVGYPNPDQQYEIERLQQKAYSFDIGEIDPTTNKPEIKIKDIDSAASSLARKKLIKYAIKDWKGLSDSQGNEIKCNVVNDELDDSLWSALTNNLELCSLLEEKINSLIRWDIKDKKKFISSGDSNLKAD